MPSAIQSREARCSTCGEREDPHTGLCLACLMRSAADTQLTQEFDLFADETELQRLGKYALIKEIGRGGMGVIYEARDLSTGRLVAVKKLQDQIAHDPHLLARFRREAQTAANLEHPHILPIYEVNDEADGVPFFAMKLATGGSLAERRDSLRGRFREVAALVATVARAVHYAHESGVIHRDLKPANILLDGHGQPLVSDFGLATWLHQDSDLTRTIMVFGTPGYLPPEYLQGRPEVLNPASDLYSLGVILFELLTGRLPHAASSFASMREAATSAAPSLRSIEPRAGRDLEVICARCLEVEPALRYSSVLALAEDLERWLSGRSIIARPVPVVVRAWLFARRHPALSFMSLLGLILFTAAASMAVSRQRVQTALAEATAYDGSIALLPICDLETADCYSELSKRANEICNRAFSLVTGYKVITIAAATDPVPHDGELARYSKKLGARFVVSGTIRAENEETRLVLHAVDAATGTAVKNLVFNLNEPLTRLSSELKQRIDALRFRNGETQQPKLFDPLAEKYIEAGNEHLKRHTVFDTGLAIDAFQKAVKIDPRNAGALAQLAGAMAFRSMVGERAEWLDKAIPIARQAVDTDPLLAEAHRNLSYIALLRGELPMALSQAFAAYELDPNDAVAANAVAEAYCNLGQMDRALLWNRKATARQTTPGHYALNCGDYLAALGEFELADAAFREYMEFRPDLPDGLYAQANILLLQGRTREALDKMRDVTQSFPAHPVVVQMRACVEFQAGNSDTAEQLFQSLSDEDAGLIGYLSCRRLSVLGSLEMRRGDSHGLKLISQALSLDEERLQDSRQDAVILFERGANLCMLGNVSAAIESLSAAVSCGEWTYYQIKLDPRLSSIRETEPFARLLAVAEKRRAEIKKQYLSQLNQN